MKFTASAMPGSSGVSKTGWKSESKPDRIEDWEQFRSLAALSVAEPVDFVFQYPTIFIH
ncbi:hypothetical protein O9992_15380 [Vibrio lentus]|nr:hypothetical protein [Vibrio lentus]